MVGGLGGLDRDGRVPLFRDDVRTPLEVGTLEEVRRVIGDAMVEVDALKGRDGVHLEKLNRLRDTIRRDVSLCRLESSLKFRGREEVVARQDQGGQVYA